MAGSQAGLSQAGSIADQAMAAGAGKSVHGTGDGEVLAVLLYRYALKRVGVSDRRVQSVPSV